ncbi:MULTISPECIES: hypothetical protein [unclassified Variovorax]|uniref:hypothetical protein n=1 Tax=unclassified Variovorax TaxID=663243 RepID=UPI000839A4BB|nr:MULTISPECIES: hypothetical protein [unclassified Variovorax]
MTPARHPGQARQSSLPLIRRTVAKDVTRALTRAKRALPADDITAADAFIAHAQDLIDSSSGDALDLPNDQRELLADIEKVLACMQEAVAKHPEDTLEGQQQRRCALIDCLCGPWAINLRNVAARTGLVVTLSTLMRDAVAFEVSKSDALGESSLSISSILAIAIAPTLNVLGGILSVGLGTANRTSVMSRLVLGVFNLGVILACYETGKLEEYGNAISPFVCYSVARDTCNYFFPLRDNLTSLPTRAVFASGGIYSLFQCFGGMAMATAFPLAGASGLPRAVGFAATAAAELNVSHSLGHSVTNSLLEIKDDLVFGAFARWFGRDSSDNFSIQEEGVHARYIEELSAFAKQLLDTPAEQRQQMINTKNFELYGREIQRLEDAGEDGLDGAHKQYLTCLRRELDVYKKTKTLDRQWLSLSLDRNIFSFEELQDLAKTERELGVYRKARELDRLRGLALDRPQTERQMEYLAALETEVEKDEEELKRIEQSGSPISLEEEVKKTERRAHLLSARDRDPSPLHARLRPIPSLESDVQKTPDFTCFDRMIRETTSLLARAQALTLQTRGQIVQEIFVDAFLRAYFPGVRTPVELAVLASLNNEDSKTVPSERKQTFVQEVAEARREASDGYRVHAEFRSFGEMSWAELFESLGRQLLLTDAARQNVFANVVGTSMLLDDWVQQNFDERTQLLIGGLVLGICIFVVYAPLYLLHTEGASPERRVDRPGAQGGFPPLRREEELREVLTPRPDGAHTMRTDERAISEAQTEYEPDSDSSSNNDYELGRISTPRILAD